jgi:uncharacterized protein YjgD (DUF1641 family)
MSAAMLPNEPPSEVERLVQATREALTDSMVERLAVTGANALELVDRLNDERTSEAIHALIDRVTELHKVGALDTLFDTVMLLHAARNASTDNIVERLFTFVEQMINTVGNEAMGRLADNTRQALDEAAEETARAAPKGGILATLSLLARPEAQQSLAFLLRFGEKLQRRTLEP